MILRKVSTEVVIILAVSTEAVVAVVMAVGSWTEHSPEYLNQEALEMEPIPCHYHENSFVSFYLC